MIEMSRNSDIEALIISGPHAGQTRTIPHSADQAMLESGREATAEARQDTHETPAAALTAFASWFNSYDHYRVLPRATGAVLVYVDAMTEAEFVEWADAWGYKEYAWVVCIDEPPEDFDSTSWPFKRGDVRSISTMSPAEYLSSRTRELARDTRWQDTVLLTEVDPQKVAEYRVRGEVDS